MKKNAQQFFQTLCVEHDNSLSVYEFKRRPCADQDNSAAYNVFQHGNYVVKDKSQSREKVPVVLTEN